MPDTTDLKQIDVALRAYIKSFCAPIWWESAGQTVVNNGSMCVVQTQDALFGITNCHVLKTYEKCKEEKDDIFCQLGSGPFDPSANLISCSEHWDLATFTLPELTLKNFKYRVFAKPAWPPAPLQKDDVVVYGGYPEERRSVPPGPNPPEMTAEFVSFRGRPNNCSPEDVSFQIDLENLTWLPNVDRPLQPDANLSGMSGGPCVRLLPEQKTIELAGIIYQGRWDVGIIFARQACLISATGRMAPIPPGIRPRKLAGY
jgi:hypothetical protein